MAKIDLEKLMKKLPLYKIELEVRNNKNYLKFLPSVWVDVGLWCLYISIEWLWLNMTLTMNPNIMKGKKTINFYLIPHFSLSKISAKCKEKYDFQFFWLWMGYRKFFGERKDFEESLKEKGYEICRFKFKK